MRIYSITVRSVTFGQRAESVLRKNGIFIEHQPGCHVESCRRQHGIAERKILPQPIGIAPGKHLLFHPGRRTAETVSRRQSAAGITEQNRSTFEIIPDVTGGRILPHQIQSVIQHALIGRKVSPYARFRSSRTYSAG